MHEELESALNELEGPLRRAVEQVRAEPVPQEGLERSLEQAGRLPMQNVTNRAPQYHVAFAGLVGLAASVLIALIFWPASRKGSLAMANAGRCSCAIDANASSISSSVLARKM